MAYTQPYSMFLILFSALKVRPEDLPPEASSPPPVPDLLPTVWPRLLQLVEQFRSQPVSPATTHQFERQLQDELRELGRQLTQWTVNHLEPANPRDLPAHVAFGSGLYTRLNQKTPQNAWTLFGQIRLYRVGYRPTDKNGEPCIFPLALSLGLIAGASPALADRAARLLAETGMSQRRALQRLKQDHGVGWGVTKLREVTQAVAAALTPHRHDVQVEQLLGWLTQAAASTGKHKPVLHVGRDAIALWLSDLDDATGKGKGKGKDKDKDKDRTKAKAKTKTQAAEGDQEGSDFAMASTATVTVLDRRGRRLGTIYLAHAPEPGQVTLSQELTQLLQEVLRRWQGPLPRLSYVTDAGERETDYYDRVLQPMTHPVTGKPLEWVRVVDYYHASQRIWTLAEVLFGKGRAGTSWARKMLRWLLKPGGVNRVLHSAANFRCQFGLEGPLLEVFGKAYRYLRTRLQYMRYADYRAVNIPLGSGVTEAACKTVYTQRLKLSGMRWQKPGAQTVLNLRVLLLSGVWDVAFQRFLQAAPQAKVAEHSAELADCPENTA